MEGSLSKAHRAFSDYSAMAAKLNAMNDNAEEQVRSHQREAIHLVHLAANDTTEASNFTKITTCSCTKKNIY
jgi:alpha-1,4-galacturonosyltransferase